jgi:hypothetical protein
MSLLLEPDAPHERRMRAATALLVASRMGDRGDTPIAAGAQVVCDDRESHACDSRYVIENKQHYERR